MTVKEVLRDMGAKCFSEEHFDELRSSYLKRVGDGDYAEVEEDYRKGINALHTKLTENQLALVSEAEAAYGENLRYAARYGFVSGLVVGFRHYLNPRHQDSASILEAFQAGLFEAERMKHHPAFNQRNDRCLEISEALKKEISEELCEDVVSVDCAWGERIYYAAHRDYYLGYRVALACLDCMDPLASASMLSETLLLEYNLGLICSYDALENRRSHRAEEDPHGGM